MVGRRAAAALAGGHGRPVEEVVDTARQCLHRLHPVQAHDAMRGGAILVEIRPHAQRLAEGHVPGALHVERNVLEWRFDPRSEARLPQATSYDLHLIIMCPQGYASSLAAASLQDLGLHHAAPRHACRAASTTAPARATPRSGQATCPACRAVRNSEARLARFSAPALRPLGQANSK